MEPASQTAPHIDAPTALVTGATGFIGRWLILELTRRKRAVAVLLRRPDGIDELRTWVAERGGDALRLHAVEGDLDRRDLGLGTQTPPLLTGIQDVFNCAGRFAFGLTRESAHRTNVEGLIALMRFSTQLSDLRRLVHVSGYRVTSDLAFPLAAPEADELYQRHGAYEASKLESHAAAQVIGGELGIPVTVVAPGAVIGNSQTGETSQLVGLGGVLQQLWMGKLAALPGSDDIFLPVVPVDELAQFMAAIPDLAEGQGKTYYLLDPDTPPLHDLIREAASRMGVKPPRFAIPLSILRRLPRQITRTHPESFSFLATDRYDTASAELARRRLGLRTVAAREAIDAWTAFLISTRFLSSPPDQRRSVPRAPPGQQPDQDSMNRS